jgi:hypothetical protein
VCSSDLAERADYVVGVKDQGLSLLSGARREPAK